jgi:hypothetical protein
MHKKVSVWNVRVVVDDVEYQPYIDKLNGFRQYLFDFYGISNIDYSFCYDVVDESKFNLFMLKYPECIEKISYE